MRYYNLIILLGIICIFNACINEKVQIINADYSLDFDENQVDTTLYRTIDEINFLALEATENSDIYEVDKMVIKNELIFIGDFHAKKIVAYDMYGKVKYVLDKKGLGPQEYLELKTFTVDDQNLYTLDNYRHVINVYDCHTGMYRETRKIPFVAWDMEVLGTDQFIFTFIPLEGGVLRKEQLPYKVWVTDKNMQIKNKYFKYEEDEYEFIGKTTYFTTMQDGIVFSSMGSDDFTLFFTGDSLKNIAINFANRIPDKFRREKNKILENGYNYISQTPIVCKKYIAFEFGVKDNTLSYIYDENAKRFFTNTDIDSYNYLFQPIATYQNQLVSYVDNYSIYEELIETGFVRADTVIENYLKEEGAILIFYSMR